MKVLIVLYDNGSHISFLPMGPAYVAAAIREAGHEVSFYNQDVYHWPDEHLAEYVTRNHFDAVGLGACGGYYQYRKILSLCEALAGMPKSKRPKIFLGGHLVSPDPGYFLQKTKADFICIGESEITIVELLDAIGGNRSYDSVKGIAFMSPSGDAVITGNRELIQDIDSIAYPAYDLLPMDHYTLKLYANQRPNQRSASILSGRGCTFKCNFCYRIDKGFRPRKTEKILEEMWLLKDNYNVDYFAFQDELLMSSKERTMEFSQAIIDAGLSISWSCNGRLNYASASREMLALMKKAGCVFINYGIESVNDEALRNMHKSLTVNQIIKGVENTLAENISPGLNIIFGNIGETKQMLEADVEFLLKYDDHAQCRTIRPVTPYPGSPLYYYAIEKGLLKDCADFYKKNTNSDLLTVNFTDMTDDEYYQELHKANLSLLNRYNEIHKKNMEETLEQLYVHRNAHFRGFRPV